MSENIIPKIEMRQDHTPIIISVRNLLVIIISTLGFLPLLISSGGIFTNGDACSQLLPMIIETKRMLQSGAPMWSWNSYLGDNFIGGYTYYTLTNPFALFCCLFPYKYIPLAFTLSIYLKLLVCAYVAETYFRKMGFNRTLSLMGCLLYTFCTWGVANTFYYMFTEPMIMFMVIMNCIERFVRNESYACTYLSLATCLAGIINFYFLPCVLFPAAAYFLVRLFQEQKAAKMRVILSLKAFGCVSIGVIAAAVVILPALIQLQGSGKQEFTVIPTIWSVAEKFQSLFLPKYMEGRFGFLLLDSFCSSNNATVLIFGVLPTILIYKSKKYRWVSLLTVFFIIVYLTPINSIFSLFTKSSYSRWLFALSAFEILAALYYIKEYHTISLKAIIIFSVFCLSLYLILSVSAILYYAFYKHDTFAFTIGGRSMAMGIILIASMLSLFYIGRKYGTENWSRISILLVVFCSILQLWAYSIVNNGLSSISNIPGKMKAIEAVERKEVAGFNDYNNGERTSFNLDFTDISCINYSLMNNHPSVEYFSSTRNPIYDPFVCAASGKNNYKLVSTNVGTVSHPSSYYSLLSVGKLYLFKGGSVEWKSEIPKGEIIAENDFHVEYEYPLHIPMGFAYDNYVVAEDIKPDSLKYREDDVTLGMLNTLIIGAQDTAYISPYLSKSEFSTELSLDSLVRARRQYTCHDTKCTSKGLTTRINLPEPKVIFFSTAADKGFTGYIDGEATRIINANLGLSAIVVPAGNHVIELKYFTPGLVMGGIISSIAFGFILLIFIGEYLSINRKRYSEA